MTVWPSEIYVYSAILLLALCSVLTRAGFMLFGDYVPLPDGVRRALRYAPAAALTAIIVPDLLPWKAGAGPALDYRLAVATGAGGVLLPPRSSVVVIVAGMPVWWKRGRLAGRESGTS